MYGKMLVALDGSELSECVLPHLEAFRRGFPECRVTLLRVVERVYDTVAADTEMISPEQWKAREQAMATAAGDYLKQAAARLEQRETPVRTEVVVGRTEEQIIEYADRENIDIILMGTHGRSGVKRWAMGSVADRVLRSVNVPVLMVRVPGEHGAG
jgi:nucleotide-binding universal stress UspA family protein